jgi:hypothetical protein
VGEVDAVELRYVSCSVDVLFVGSVPKLYVFGGLADSGMPHIAGLQALQSSSRCCSWPIVAACLTILAVTAYMALGRRGA